MKLNSNTIKVLTDPLRVASVLSVTGGSTTQFFDGNFYSPNREGTAATPLLLTHTLSIKNSNKETIAIQYTTDFYENETLIIAGNSYYELLGNSLKVKKNVVPNSAIVIKAVSKFIDTVSDKVYEQIDSISLRTLIKTEEYQLILSQHGNVYFDGYRNPNTQTTVTASMKKGISDVTDFTGISFKWLNVDGLDCVENELYACAYSADMRTLTVDKTYIDKETIRCEAWKDGKLLAFDSVTFTRKFNSFQHRIIVPELPLHPTVNTLTCEVIITDTIGNVNVDAAFMVDWYAVENGVSRKLGYSGARVVIPRSAINLKASSLSIYTDIKRREAFAGLTTDDGETLLTDDLDNILSTETYGL